MTPNVVTRDLYRIRSYEIDPSGRLAVPALWRMLQESAGNSARSLGFSVEHLFEHGVTWVLARFRLAMASWPEWQHEIAVETWPAGTDGVRAYREFRVRDDAGRLIGTASSLWTVFDLNSRRPVRVPEFIMMARPDAGEASDELPPGVDRAWIALDTLRKPAEGARARRFHVRWGDLDLNRHANNATYVEWAIESVDPDVLESMRPVAVAIDYRTEARFGDEIVASADTVPREGGGALTIAHRIATGAGRDLALGRTIWMPIPAT